AFLRWLAFRRGTGAQPPLNQCRVAREEVPGARDGPKGEVHPKQPALPILERTGSKKDQCPQESCEPDHPAVGASCQARTGLFLIHGRRRLSGGFRYPSSTCAHACRPKRFAHASSNFLI